MYTFFAFKKADYTLQTLTRLYSCVKEESFDLGATSTRLYINLTQYYYHIFKVYSSEKSIRL